MNPENQHPEETPEQNSSSTPETESRPCDDLGSAFRNAVDDGVNDAKSAAKEAIPKVKEDFAKGVHDIAYGVSYALSFGATLAKEFTPDIVANGFTEGNNAGKKAATEFAEKQRASRPGATAQDNENPPILV